MKGENLRHTVLCVVVLFVFRVQREYEGQL